MTLLFEKDTPMEQSWSNLENHRIIDILDSRDTKDVEKWLKTKEFHRTGAKSTIFMNRHIIET